MVVAGGGSVVVAAAADVQEWDSDDKYSIPADSDAVVEEKEKLSWFHL